MRTCLRGHLCTRADTTAPQHQKDAHLLRVHGDIAHGIVLERRDRDVGVLDGILVIIVRLLAILLQLEEAPVQLVDRQHWADALAERLAQHGLCLDRHAFDAIDDDQRAVCDA